jgi:hypothetical protein
MNEDNLHSIKYSVLLRLNKLLKDIFKGIIGPDTISQLSVKFT